jgi:hypothetical protein
MLYNEYIEVYFGEPINADIELSVCFNYSKGEPEIIRADPNDCQQGSGDEVEILSIMYNGAHVKPMLYMGDFEDELKVLCMEVVSQ